MRIKHTWMGLFLLAVTPLVACELLGAASEGIRIDVPDQTFEFSLNVTELRSQLETEINKLVEPDISLATAGKLPNNIVFDQTFALDIPGQAIDFSNSSQFQEAKSKGSVSGIYIKYVRYTFDPAEKAHFKNTINFGVPWLDLYLGNHDLSQMDKLARIEGIGPSTVEGEVLGFVAGGRDRLSDKLMEGKLALAGKTEIRINTADSLEIPSGELVGQIVVGLQIEVDPF